MLLVAQWLVVLGGVWLIAVAVLMFARPSVALHCLSRMASTRLINYTEISLRMIWGIAIMIFADASAFPVVLWVFGLFVAITSAVLYFVPRRWHAAYAVWWSQRLTRSTVQSMAPLSLAFGGFMIYAAV